MSEKDISTYSLEQLRQMRERGEGRTDWDRVRALSDEDIEKAVADDPDTFIPGPEWWEKATVVLPPASRKVPLSIRLDPEVVEFFKDQGPGYQSRINAVLRSYIAAMRGAPREK